MSDSEEEALRPLLLMHLRQQASTTTPSASSGTRARRAHRGTVDGGATRTVDSAKKVKKVTAKKGKPIEVSNRRKRPPDAVLAKNKKKKDEFRDPRFSELSGNLDVDMFGKAYGFLDEYRRTEKATLKQVAPTNSEAKAVLERMEQQDKRRLKLGKMSELKHKLNAEEKEKVKEGKTPYFYSEVDIKKRVRREEFEAIKGDKEKFLAKKRKRAAGKAKKLLPARREKHD
eukprot:GEMP01091204.1.p1 GENE.GEMP01091204.1~~GEMP01091204.1.p1  ORF type:complete len:229 (-),score=82.06 GEMP01091204.1:132-818(-)